MNKPEPSTTRILLVEDNPIDVRMLQYAFGQRADWQTELKVASDGERAINLLLDENIFAHGQSPDLIVLDLNLPKRDGTEVLHVIRTTGRLQRVPVVVLSSSPLDVIHSKVHDARVEADCYLTKPVDVDEFLALSKRLQECYESARVVRTDQQNSSESNIESIIRR
jgi:CheY-like chemotaxis protein